MGLTVGPIAMTIPSGSQLSNVVSASVFDKIDRMTAFAPSASDGLATFQMTPTLGVATASWYGMLTSAGAALTLPAATASYDTLQPAAGYRLSSSVVESGSREYLIIGKLPVSVKVLPPQEAFPITFAALGSGSV